MALILKKKKHLKTRLVPWLLVIIFLAFSPLIIGIIGAWFTELSTGVSCHEGNCAWMVLPWLSIITIPIGGIILLIYIIIVVIDAVELNQKEQNASIERKQGRPDIKE